MKKKIVILVSAMNLGGAQRVVSILCEHWSKNGYDIALVSTFTGDIDNHYQVTNNIKLLQLPKISLPFRSKLLMSLSKLVYLKKIIHSENPDIVISFLTRVNVASALSTIGHRANLIICERTWTPFGTVKKKYLWILRIILRRVDAVIVQTDRSKDWLNLNYPNLIVEVIPNPLSYPLPIDYKRIVDPVDVISSDRKIILASGRLHKYKQFDLLIRAFSAISKKYLDWDLVILGDGEEKGALKKLIKDLMLFDRVFLPGSVGNVSAWYERSSIFVLSSSVEGFPNVLLEAMSYGLPSISFNCNTGPKEMIQDGVNGFLVNPEEKENGLILALENLIPNKALQIKIAQEAIRLRDKYSLDKVMQRWKRIIEV
jgi:glycosyltransferase involved in cell wall biosynthesis